MRRFLIPGFPEASRFIDLPNIAELLVQPMYWKIDADLFRRVATDDQRAILDSAPLLNNRRHVSVAVKVNLFYPGAGYGADGRFMGRNRPWHRDGHINLFKDRPDVHHLLLSDCEVLTEFNEVQSLIELPEDATVREALINDPRDAH